MRGDILYVQPGLDIGRLSYRSKCEIVRRAAGDPEYLSEMSSQKRRDVQRAARALPAPSPRDLQSALLAMINHETALAAEQRRYNEWATVCSGILANGTGGRVFLELLVEFDAVSDEMIVWTCAEVRKGELRLMRAIIVIGGRREIKLEEYWPRHDERYGLPQVKIFPL